MRFGFKRYKHYTPDAMANFSTHVSGAAAVSGLLSTMFLKAGLVGIADAFALAFAGTTGGILPDIDLKYSYPSKIVFTTLGILIAMLWVFATNANLSMVELWVFGLLLFLIIRFPLWAIFHRFTVHRGSLHSIAAAVMFGMLSVALASRVFGRADQVAWLIGLFVFIGTVFHLLLDEIYSVDFVGRRIKRSFGSALKPIDFDRMVPSSLIIFVALLGWIYSPPSQGLWQQLMSVEFYEQLANNLYPDSMPEYIQVIIDRLSGK